MTAAEAIHQPAPAAQTSRRLRPHRVRWPRLRPVHVPVRVHTLDSLRYRNYRLLWVSMSCVSGGVWTQALVIGWLTYYLTGSALLTSLALGLATLPYLGSPLAGVIADRWDRRKLLASVSVGQAMLMAGFSAVVGLGLLETWHIFAFVLAMGVSWAVSDPARIALIPNTVPKRSLLNAFALNALAFNVMRLMVPVVAGVLVGLVGPGPTLALGAVLYAGAAITALAIDLPLATDEAKGRLRPWAQLVEGARYVRGEPLVLAIVLLGVVPFMLVMPFVHSLLPVYASEVFEMGPAGLGVMISALGLGATTGSVVLASVGDVRHKGRVLLLAFTVAVAAMVAFSRTASVVPPLLALMALAGALSMYFSIGGAMLQSAVPDRLRGRVSSLSMMTIGLLPFGALLSGSIAQLLDAPSATLMSAVAVAVLLVALTPITGSVWRYKEAKADRAESVR